jgi:small subunit ribosomal protein S9
VAKQVHEYSATGRRKTSVARVRIAQGDGKVKINGRDIQDFFKLDTLRNAVTLPFRVTETNSKFDVVALVSGGGPSGQSGALRHGISRALVLADINLKPALKAAGLLTRDPRMKERKKSGQPGARKRFQFSKR